MGHRHYSPDTEGSGLAPSAATGVNERRGAGLRPVQSGIDRIPPRRVAAGVPMRDCGDGDTNIPTARHTYPRPGAGIHPAVSDRPAALGG